MSKLTLPVDVEWKAAGSSTGELEGYASVFGVVDLEGDVVMPGAFRKTIADWSRASQPLPLIADHELSTSGLIGSVHHLSEDTKGLRFRARFGPTQKAQDVRANVLGGHLRGTSFTYEAIKARPGAGTVAGKAVRRFLDELRLFEITVSPFPINQLVDIRAKAISDRAWDGSAARFTPEQYRRSCLIDTGQGETDSKARYKLPVREPDGDVNRNAVHAAAAALAGGRGGVQANPDQKRAAARKLVRLYGELGEDPPDSVRRLAGAMSASQAEWLASMQQAIGITNEWARKAAVDELIGSYPADDIQPEIETDPSAASEDAPGTDGGAATGEETGDTPTPDDAYAVSFLHSNGPPDEAPDGQPPSEALPESLAALEHQRSITEIDELEADIRAALEG